MSWELQGIVDHPKENEKASTLESRNSTRTKIFDKVCLVTATKHFDPGMSGAD
jgi:hypothetical protein